MSLNYFSSVSTVEVALAEGRESRSVTSQGLVARGALETRCSLDDGRPASVVPCQAHQRALALQSTVEPTVRTLHRFVVLIVRVDAPVCVCPCPLSVLVR